MGRTLLSGPITMGEHVMKSKTFKIVRRAAAEDMAACLDCLMTALSAAKKASQTILPEEKVVPKEPEVLDRSVALSTV